MLSYTIKIHRQDQEQSENTSTNKNTIRETLSYVGIRCHPGFNYIRREPILCRSFANIASGNSTELGNGDSMKNGGGDHGGGGDGGFRVEEEMA